MTTTTSTATVVRINRSGYLVTHLRDDGGRRTYVCTDRAALHALILYLTGRDADSFPVDSRGLPQSKELIIAHPTHIWGDEPTVAEITVVRGKEDAEVPNPNPKPIDAESVEAQVQKAQAKAEVVDLMEALKTSLAAAQPQDASKVRS